MSASSEGRRRWLFVLLTIFGVIVALELGAGVLWWTSEGVWPTSSQREEARRAAQEGPLAVLQGRRSEAIPDEIRAEREVLHPYLGYVFNPELNELENRAATGDLLIDPLGFFRVAGDERAEKPGLEIGIFGGSAALLFGTQRRVRGRLRRATARAVGLEPEAINVRVWALGGYKQPQQLMTLTWLLALGRAPDVVVEIDGFNEVVLPRHDNTPKGVAPQYPRAWGDRVADLPDREQRLLEGTLSRTSRRRRWAASLAGRFPWRQSLLAGFLWRRLDVVLASELTDLRVQMDENKRKAMSYRQTGPFEPLEDSQMLAEVVRTWEESSRQMARLARANGIAYVHVLQPNQYVPGSKRLSDEERERFWREDHAYRPFVLDGYPALREAGDRLRAEGIRFLDLTDYFADEERTVYQDDCCHLSPLGNQLLAKPVAAAVAQAAKARKGFDKRSDTG